MARLLPEIVSVTPTGYETWRRCARLYRLDRLLALPASDPPPSSDEGQLVHELLRFIHESGSVHDADHVEDVLASHNADNEHYRALVARHARRVPTEFERSRQEVAVARFHRVPPPMYMATARIDAVYVHDGLLDARDYKTGGMHYDHVADDPRAQVQAWILDAYAKRQHLRLRLRYEYLAAEIDDDPEPWDPESEEIEAVGSDISAFVAELWRRDAEDDWGGVREVDVCRYCRFRSICTDSAAPSVAAWPSVTADGTAPPAASQ